MRVHHYRDGEAPKVGDLIKRWNSDEFEVVTRVDERGWVAVDPHPNAFTMNPSEIVLIRRKITD